MTDNDTTAIDMTDTIARRLADLRATPAPIMPNRPTDRSRNNMRSATRSPRRRIIR